jgi:hypothetical protein
MSEPKLVNAKWIDSCDFCDSQEGRHYCLLHGVSFKNMDIQRCADWEPREDPSTISASSEAAK